MRKLHLMNPVTQFKFESRRCVFLPAVFLSLLTAASPAVLAQDVDFAKEVLPVLKANCFKCHGEKKAKAKLRLHTQADALKGGKNGKAVEPGKASASLLVKRISLGADDDDIMPPEEGPLKKSEIAAIARWIDQGAKWPAGVTAGSGAKGANVIKVAEMPATLVAAIEKVGGRTMKLAQDTNLVTVSFRAVADKTGDAQLAVLKGAKSVTEVNLSRSKITDGGLASLSGLENLTRLHLELTGIDGSGLAHLKPLKRLHYLNLYGTKVDDKAVAHISALKGLKKLYLWQTAVTDAGVASIEKALPGIGINRGLVAAKKAEPPAKPPAKPAAKPAKASVVIAQSTAGWKFTAASAIKGEDWLKVAFDDGKWTAGKTPIGYGEPSIAQKKGTTASLQGQPILFRRKFAVDKKLIDSKSKFRLQVASDNSATVWINGKQVDKEDGDHEATYWNRTVEIAAGLLKQDGNVVSVLVNNQQGSSDIFLDLHLESTGP